MVLLLQTLLGGLTAGSIYALVAIGVALIFKVSRVLNLAQGEFVTLGALALGRLGYGLLLIVAFGVGMAVVLTATGFVLVYGGRLVARLVPGGDSPVGRLFNRGVPWFSAGVMTLVGLVATAQALAQFRP